MPETATTRADWVTVAFGDVVRQVKDKVDPDESGLERYIAGEHMDTDDLRIRRWGEIGDDYLGPAFHMRFKPGHVLYGSRRTYLRKVALADFEGITANTTYVLESKDPDVLLPDLLPFIMQAESFHAHSKRESKGSVNPYVNFSDLAWYELCLPTLSEQRRIAGLLRDMEQVTEALFALRNATRIAQAAMFGTRLDSFKPQPVPLGDLLLRPPRNGCSATESPVPTGHWVLSLSAISRWGYQPEQLKAVKRSTALEAAIIESGDLVVSRSNTRELVGLPAVFPEDRRDISYPDTMMRLSFDPSSIDSHFIELCLRTPECRREVQSYAAGTSASMKKINGTNLSKVKVPIVSLKHQTEVLRDVGEVDRVLRGIEARISSAETVKSSILAATLPASGGSP